MIVTTLQNTWRSTGAAREVFITLSALSLGAVAMIAPMLALALLAGLAALSLLRAEAIRIDVVSASGPLLAALIVGSCVSFAGAVGVLFVWRLFADARWSIAEASRKSIAAGRAGEASSWALAHAWTTPAFGLVLVAYTSPHMVAGLPLDLPHVPLWAPIAVGVAAGAAVLDWALRRAAEWRLGDVAVAPALHLGAHHLVFIVAFGVGLDVSAGIVAMAAWRLLHALRQPSFTAVP
jgi:hypothetical protein